MSDLTTEQRSAIERSVGMLDAVIANAHEAVAGAIFALDVRTNEMVILRRGTVSEEVLNEHLADSLIAVYTDPHLVVADRHVLHELLAAQVPV